MPAKTPQQLGAVAAWEPFRGTAGNKGLIDRIGTHHLHAHLGSTKAAFLAGTAGLVLPGTSGNYASAPDLAAYTPSASLDVRYDGTLPGTTSNALVSQYGAAGSRGWVFRVSSSGSVLELVTSSDGTATTSQLSGAHGVALSGRYQYRVLAQLAGTVTFYKRDPALGLALSDDTNWTQVSTHSPAAFSVFNTGATLNVGSVVAGTQNLGEMRACAACVKVDGATVFNADFAAAAEHAASFTESSSNAATVTINASAADTNDPTFDGASLNFATDDYASVADAAALNFGAAMTCFVVVKAASQSSRAIAAQHDTGTNQRSWRLDTLADKARVVLASAGSGTAKIYESSLTAFDNTWKSVAFTFGSGVLKILVNAAEDATPTITQDLAVASLHDSTVPLTLGASLATGAPVGFLNGSIAAVALFPTALSAADVASLHEHYKAALAADGVTLPAGPTTGGPELRRLSLGIGIGL